jgi:hypothetical protein
VDNGNIVDKRRIRLEDVLKPGYIPFLGGRPDRGTVIGVDEILDLVILLNTTATVEAFINKL